MGKKKENPDQTIENINKELDEKENNMKTTIKKAVITSIILTAVLTAGAIYGGMKLYGFIYSQGFNAANEQHATVFEQATELKEAMAETSKTQTAQ